jgi:hypothetical protein
MSKILTRSVLGSETMALADAFDMAFTIRHDLQNITRLQIPIIVLTDSLSLFDVITKATTTSEKWLMIDLTAAKEAYKTIRHDLQNITGLQIPIIILTDSLSLFDVITKAKTTFEKRLLIDLTAAKEAYKKREIYTIGFVRTEDNPANVFTKITRWKILDDILQKSLLDHPVEQWITRTN